VEKKQSLNGSIRSHKADQKSLRWRFTSIFGTKTYNKSICSLEIGVKVENVKLRRLIKTQKNQDKKN